MVFGVLFICYAAEDGLEILIYSTLSLPSVGTTDMWPLCSAIHIPFTHLYSKTAEEAFWESSLSLCTQPRGLL